MPLKNDQKPATTDEDNSTELHSYADIKDTLIKLFLQGGELQFSISKESTPSNVYNESCLRAVKSLAEGVIIQLDNIEQERTVNKDFALVKHARNNGWNAFQQRQHTFSGKYKSWSVMNAEERALYLFEYAEVHARPLTKHLHGFHDMKYLAINFYNELLQRLILVRDTLFSKKKNTTTLSSTESKEKPSEQKLDTPSTVTTWLPLTVENQLNDLIAKMRLAQTLDIETLTRRETTPWCYQVIRIITADYANNYNKYYSGELSSPYNQRAIQLHTDLAHLQNAAKDGSHLDAKQQQIMLQATKLFTNFFAKTSDEKHENYPFGTCLAQAITKALVAIKNNEIGIALRDQLGNAMQWDDNSVLGQTYKLLEQFISPEIAKKLAQQKNYIVADELESDEFIPIEEETILKASKDNPSFYDKFTKEYNIIIDKNKRINRYFNQNQDILYNLSRLPNENRDIVAFENIKKFIFDAATEAPHRKPDELIPIIKSCLTKARTYIWQPTTLATKTDTESKTQTPPFNLHHAVTDLIATIEIAEQFGYAEMLHRSTRSYGYQVLDILDKKLDYKPSSNLVDTLLGFVSSKTTEAKTELRPIDKLYAELKQAVIDAKNELAKNQQYPTLESQLAVINTVTDKILVMLEQMHETQPFHHVYGYGMRDDVKEKGKPVRSILTAVQTAHDAINHGEIGINTRDKSGQPLTKGDKAQRALLLDLLKDFDTIIRENAFDNERRIVIACSKRYEYNP